MQDQFRTTAHVNELNWVYNQFRGYKLNSEHNARLIDCEEELALNFDKRKNKPGTKPGLGVLGY